MAILFTLILHLNKDFAVINTATFVLYSHSIENTLFLFNNQIYIKFLIKDKFVRNEFAHVYNFFL